MKVDRETLDELGVAPAGRVLSDADCRRLVDSLRRRRALPLDGRHGPVPLRPGPVPVLHVPAARARRRAAAAFWPHLLPIAREWAERLGRAAPWPDELDDWLERCHAAGQRRPTPLMLRTGRVTGTRCTVTCTASWCSRCRSSSGWTRPAPTTPAASSSSSSNARGRSRGRRRRSSARARPSCSPPATGLSARRGAGRRRRCATA